MQAKKRAKPVKFGKPAEDKREAHEEIRESEEVREEAVRAAEQKAPVVQDPHPATSSDEKISEVVQKEEHIREDLTYKQKEPDITYSQTREEEIRTQELRDNRDTDGAGNVPQTGKENYEVPAGHDIREESREYTGDPQSVDREEEPREQDLPAEYMEQTQQELPQREQSSQEQENYPSLGGDTYIVEKEVRSGMLGYFFLIAIIAFLIGIGSMAAANFYLLNSKPSFNLPFMNAAATPTPTVEPTRAPTPTAAAVDKSKVTISVLNGSGITGAAAKLETSLDTEGYNVVDRGNADNSDYTETVIRAKDTVNDSYLDALSEFLSETYSVASEIETASGSADDADVTIIIGSKEAASN